MRKPFFVLLSVFGVIESGYAVDLYNAIQNTKTICSGISDSMNDMKLKAGINTAVTSVGTVAGGVALGTGIAKASVDKKIETLEEFIKYLETNNGDQGACTTIEMSDQRIKELIEENPSTALSRLEEKSKKLGNIRTGTLAVSTVTNVAGTAIAATNKVSADLEENIQKCIQSVKELSSAKVAARVEKTATDSEMAIADKIINACRDYEYVDTKPINKRAIGAAVAAGFGAGTGFVGTITSAVANSNNIRAGDAQKEKSLNATANVMAGASTVAGATATVFNATQIAAIKKVVNVADNCEGALK